MKSTILLVLPIAAFVLLLSSGCTIVGYAVGSEIDRGSAPVYAPAHRSDLLTLSSGDPLRVQTEGEDMRQVVFEELVLPKEGRILADVVDAGAESVSDWGVYPGDRIRVNVAGEDEETGVLLGATTTGLWFRRSDDVALRRVPFSRLISLRSGEVAFTGMYLRKLVEGKLPMIYDVKVTDGADSISIPVRSIVRLQIPTTESVNTGVMAGVGAAVDITLILLASGALAALFVAMVVAGSK